MNGRDTQRDRLVYPLAGIVMIGWMTSLIYAVLTNQYTPLTVVTPVMLLLAGYVFGSNIIRSSIRERDNER